MKKKLNILYLNCHDCGRYLSPYGYAVPTPNLKALAERGTLYRNMHSVSPTCSPSRTAMLTGLSPVENGMVGLAHRGFSMKDPERHLARYLRQNGYRTAVSGVQHEWQGNNTPGWQLYEEELPVDYDVDEEDDGKVLLERDRRIAQAAAAYLGREHESPFFLACGFFLPHRPFPANGRHDPKTLRPPEPVHDCRDTRLDWAGYATAVEAMDTAVGRVLDALESSRVADQTLVLFTTDHGPAFPEMKCQLKDFGTNVAFLLDYPGNPAAGGCVDALVSHLDVVPTLADLAGFPKPSWAKGHSMEPLQAGQVEEIQDHVFAEVNYHVAAELQRSVRSRRFKLIRRFDKEHTVVPSNIDNSLSKDFVLKVAGGLDAKLEPVSFYDLWRDPMEAHNLADNPDYAQPFGDLDALLQDWMVKREDPALSSESFHPEGAEVADRGDWEV